MPTLRPSRLRFKPAYRHLFMAATLVAGMLSLAGCGIGDNRAIAMQQVMRDSARYTTIQWLDSARDFGTIPEGQTLNVSFRFRNTGSSPLVITQVRPSCGCTVPEQPQEPVAPGAEGKINASFNSVGHPGVQRKTLFVTANTKGSQNYSLHFTVVVDKKTS